MRKQLTYLTVLLFLGSVACKRINSVSSDTSTDLTPKDELTKPADLQLINPLWILTEIGGKAVTSKTEIYVHFIDGSKVEGFSGCNTFNGKYTTDGADIEIGPLVSTKMTCEEQTVENQLLFALKRAVAYTADAKILILKNDDGVLAKFAARPIKK